MPANLPILATGLLVVALSAAAGVAADSGDKMTICHMPPGDPSGARTLQVPRSAWSGHQGHGDHQGACTDGDRKAHPPTSSPAPAKATHVALVHDEGDGELDGDASFKVVAFNHGLAPATGVRLAGDLGGDGRWSLRSDVPGCSFAKGRLACELGSLPAESSVTLRLDYDGHLDVCREVGIDLQLTAANDATAGDDRAKESVRVGACAPIARSAPSAASSPIAALPYG
ncbi:MAG TPA: hypothetical protein VJ874_00095 [Candidatus Thermoplasmatota archaeon]|nr:hypothetical protein [Candidatus Thermoplasmatota archaeon]